MSRNIRLTHTLNAHPWIVALVLTVLLIGWMASGVAKQDEVAKAEESSVAVPKVQVQSMTAQAVTRSILLYGRTEPNRKATLRAETAGRVVELMAERGAWVKEGQPLVRLAMNDRQQKLQQALAENKQREIEYQGAKRLSSQGFSGKARLAESEAQLEQARSNVAELQLDIDHTVITAPFDGILNERLVEIGDYLGVADPIAMMYDINPLIVRADAGQHDITQLRVGLEGTALFVDGNSRQGKVRYLSKVADSATNTFRLELALENPDADLYAGMSAELELPLATVDAIKVTPALLALDEDGNLGIKSVIDKTVQFTPIELIKADNDGVWLTGFGGQVDVITLGQGFVRPGDEVTAVFANDAR
ncbi:efflux RND transporter periplasmic adaptor subunit [Echinimonas agarilytica]|uniref:Efflux RND transporter periplasmic adaptor subunit n=1 Tax=Echinimonas agarilytica TaxID=1215918 RepID=A0AA41W4J6_9GAMM|nr:efflux RND transporter periplasmic adaptor subunit [Echinimonas agarilytica]MCM2678646.1 efflux RND transporter periplasmic adaptor subunit [Echinimonas agarilytica]